MNDHDLPSIAQKAIEHVLRYRDSCHAGFTDRHKAIIKDRIEALLPLKSLAADPDVANIEIVSDAAMSFLDVYNQEHLDAPVSQKWLYIGVQTLASIDLKPALMRGDVRRLPEPSIETEIRTNDRGPDSHDLSQPDETEAHAGPAPSDSHDEPLTAPSSNNDDSPQDEQDSIVDDEWSPVKTSRPRKRRSSGPPVANGKDPWGDEEIKKLIKWKAQGMTHKEVGARLGRTEPACAIRHSIVLKQERWLELSRVYREKRATGEISEDEAENEAGATDEQAKEDAELNEEAEETKQEDDKENCETGGKGAVEQKEAKWPLDDEKA